METRQNLNEGDETRSSDMQHRRGLETDQGEIKRASDLVLRGGLSRFAAPYKTKLVFWHADG